ncbi:MopE-related protein [Gaetbulibacter saemankumensis]|uniref:MopE-related protein n=1 Tax=Gaetbulibacter saemankumensis TaxID=311208 RepID=UPI0003F5C6F9|nr:MopE-related protein [Gaetbulibacter saemankumensis]
MKNILPILLLLFIYNFSHAQCTNKTLYNGTVIPNGININDGEVHQIAYGIEAGEYIVLTGLNTGDSYKFTSIRSDINNPNNDYLTIYNESGQVIASQTAPLNINPLGTSNIEIHINLNFPGCEVEELAHTLTIQNLSAATCNMPRAPGGITFKSDTRIDFYWSPPELSTPLGYDWRITLKDASPDNYMVSGSTMAPETNASSGNVLTPGETYWIYVRSSCASNETSGWFRFPSDYVMNTIAPPDNDFCEGAISVIQDINTAGIGDATVVQGDLSGGAGTNKNAETCNTKKGNARDDVWYKFTAQTPDVHIYLSPTFDGVLTLYSGDCNALNYLECSDNPSEILSDEEIYVSNGLTVGQTYYIRVYYLGTTTPANPTFDLWVWSSSVATDNDMDGYVDHPDIDCDDNVASIHPDAIEIPNNGIDEDCDGADLKTWYLDSDNDNFGTIDEMILSNTQPEGYVLNSSDCNDDNDAVNPGATEVCDTIDNDCDGLVDDNDPSVANQVTYYVDLDEDGYGDSNDAGTDYCSSPGTGYSLTNNDCNDNVASIHPDATEIPNNGVDDNCDGQTDETLSVIEIDLNDILVRPNPFSSHVFIDIPQNITENLEIVIFDMSGRMILSSIKTMSRSSVDLKHLESLPKGIYFMKFSVRNQVVTKKLIKL